MNFLTGLFLVVLLFTAAVTDRLFGLIGFVLLVLCIESYAMKRKQSKKRSQLETKNFLPAVKPVAQTVIAQAPERIMYLGRNPALTATILNQRKIEKRKEQSGQSMARHASIRKK
jgi:hypothetical protein